MHPIQARLGGLLVVTGFTLALVFRAGWAIVVGPALLVAGGLMLALAAEPMVAEGRSVADVDEPTEPRGKLAA